MGLRVRPARPQDPADGLLYASSRPYYDAYAGGEAAARRLLAALYPRPGHSASYDICAIAELDGRIAGVVAGFPAATGDRLAQRFISLSLPRLGPWRWPRVLRHLLAAGHVAPRPRPGAWYVDALAVAPEARRRGVATALLAAAEDSARAAGASGLALDTGIANHGARALYLAAGFTPGPLRHAPDQRTARAIGGPGFVGYYKAL